MGDIVKTRSGELNFFPGRVGVGVLPSQQQFTVGGNISAIGAILANGSITTDSYVYSDNYLGTWNGTEILFDNQYIDGDLTVVGDIIEYASNGIVFSKTSIFTKTLVPGANTLQTFDKLSFKTAKYVVTLSSTLSSTTAFEILVTHNGTNSDGTTYGIVDAQTNSLLSAVDVGVTGNTIDLTITTTGECDVIAHGTAHY